MYKIRGHGIGKAYTKGGNCSIHFPVICSNSVGMELVQKKLDSGKELSAKEKVDDSILIAETNWKAGSRKAYLAVYNWDVSKKASAHAMLRYMNFLQSHPSMAPESFDAKEESRILAKLEKTASEPPLISDELRVSELGQPEIETEKVLQKISESELCS